jgi:uncharacterized membrane-anchored protein
MAKRPSLAESMKAVARPVPAVASMDEQRPVLLETSAAPAEPATKYRAKTREGMKRLTVVVDPAEHRRVKRLSADTDRSIEDLMREAIASLLEKHNA